MSVPGVHLTAIGSGDFLLEPTRSLDISKRSELIEGIIRRLQGTKSQRLYYDLAELPVIDPVYFGWLNALARACQTVNVQMVCIHMQPTAAFALSRFVKDPPCFHSAHDVSLCGEGYPG
ncbi:MAG: hypothetical protein HY066_04075 [Betaproteobacteria bacterium]|nr:hypothetical protein [Betaproteobacteria bacterium]